ncbi:MAG: DUF1801 domain-containing protein [Thermomicrobiales bacterium]|nr:DUF1801 domain-containing protein [Thermomicrobiales bacterium]
MGELKTKPTDASVDAFIDAISDERKRADSRELVRLMSEVTGQPPVMWGSIIGFGSQHYRYASGQSGDWPPVAFAPRKAAISLHLYMNGDLAKRDEILTRLGRHTTGKGCIYIKRLSDVDPAALRELIEWSHAST